MRVCVCRESFRYQLRVNTFEPERFTLKNRERGFVGLYRDLCVSDFTPTIRKKF